LKKYIASLAVLLVATLAMLPTSKCQQYRLGVAVETGPFYVIPGEPHDIVVGTVTNSGNETLIVEYEWVQETGLLALPAVMKTMQNTLAQGDSFNVVLVLAAMGEEYLGNYTGYTDITTEPLNPLGGNPVMPGGYIPSTFVVAHLLPADFMLYGLSLSKTQVLQNDTLFGSITVKNVGEQVGSYTATARLDDEVLDTKTVTLEGDKVRKLDFLVKVDVVGNHTFSVDGYPDQLTFMVESLSKDENVEIPVEIVVVLLPVSLGIIAVFVRRRKNTKEKKMKP